MKVSVVIPTHNSAKLIGATLDSVFSQTVPPDEILILDDGSKDDTVSLLRSYGDRIIVLQQKNQGVAAARNALTQKARGDLIAFLDHDDLWHPNYLETQRESARRHPGAVAFFTGHLNMPSAELCPWRENLDLDNSKIEVIAPVAFFERYNRCPGEFGSMSFCCIPKQVFLRLGKEPFPVELSGADDYYLMNRLSLLGSVVFSPIPLVAYRLTEGSLSANRLKSVTQAVRAFEILEPRFAGPAHMELAGEFSKAFASKRRYLAQFLMGDGRTVEARRQFVEAIKASWNPSSVLKSLALFLLTFLPASLQPVWLSSDRAIR